MMKCLFLDLGEIDNDLIVVFLDKNSVKQHSN
jgi:hypothetical protein